MKNALNQSNIPIILLFLVFLKSIVISTPLFDSVAIIAASALFGAKLWLDHIKKPDYSIELNEKIEKMNHYYSEKMTELDIKVTSVSGAMNLGKVAPKAKMGW